MYFIDHVTCVYGIDYSRYMRSLGALGGCFYG